MEVSDSLAGWALVTWLSWSLSPQPCLPRGVKLSRSIGLLEQLCLQCRGAGQGCGASQHLCPHQACQPLSVCLGSSPGMARHGSAESRGGGAVSGKRSWEPRWKESRGCKMLLLTSIKERKDEMTLTPVFVLWSLVFKLIKNTNKTSFYLLLWPLLILHLIITFYPHKYLL